MEARISTYELAAKMQTAATEALDLARETKATQEMYGMHSANQTTAEFGSRCLVARRLIERGVRFVQVYTQNQLWDSHGGIIPNLPKACEKVDQGSAALVRDLEQRGLLDETVVHWGGEMGRLPVLQNDAGRNKIGRDHNTYGFSSWVAGGGFKQGHVYGKTDDFGHKAIEDIVHHYDYHATLLHLFGLSTDDATFMSGARKVSLLDGQPGEVIPGLLA